MPRRPPPRHTAVAACLAVSLAIIGGGTWWALSINSRAHEAEQHLIAARDALSGGAAGSVLTGEGATSASSDTAVAQLSSACAEAGQADSVLTELNGQLQAISPLVDALDSMPGVGDRARTQSATLQTGAQIAAAGSAICAGLEPLASALGPMSSTDQSAGVSSTASAVQALVAAGPQLVAAADRLERTEAALDQLQNADLDSSTRSNIATLRTRLPATIQALRDAGALLGSLGGQSEHRYLLISQNPDELRPTGGYIGSAGVLSVTNGSVSLLEYGSSRMYDTPANFRASTPFPFNQYLTDYWDFAGTNWWASFPDVARQLEYFYTIARPDQPAPEGTIALDQSALQELMQVLGPVEVPEYGETVSASDLQTALDRHVHAGDSSDEAGRKQFTAALSTAVLRQALAAPKAQLPDLVRALRTALTQQHMLVSLTDTAAAGVLARHRWDGALVPAPADALSVVDTELSGSKQSQTVRRDVAYRVDLSQPATPQAKVDITYTNSSIPVPNVQYVNNYRTFVRVYAPSGAKLTGADGLTGEPITTSECSRSVFGGEVGIPRGTTAHVSFTYSLPQTVLVDGVYDLVAQSQPGVPPGQFSVDVLGPSGQDTRKSSDLVPGQSFNWQLAGNGAALDDQPLPLSSLSGCGIPTVTVQPAAAPDWLEIPKARISAQVVQIGIDPDGTMQPPPTPEVVGWYDTTARAGEPGNAVLAGHVDWGKNTAVFWGLRDLQPADEIILHGSDGVDHSYRVQWNRVFANDDPSALDVLRGSNQSLLTLITCDGVYDRTVRDYSERRIVQAVLAD